LSAEMAEAVEEKFGDLLIAFGYEVGGRAAF
jgi:hypothetical protein